MGKIIRCRDVGFDCDGVIKAATEQEALSMAAQHAKTVHNVKEVTPEMVRKIKQVIKEE
jgi:predicted small metal-binding protein